MVIKMLKAMLSQPMAGKTDEEIIATREKAIKVLQEKRVRDCQYSLYGQMVQQRKYERTWSCSNSIMLPREVA